MDQQMSDGQQTNDGWIRKNLQMTKRQTIYKWQMNNGLMSNEGMTNKQHRKYREVIEKQQMNNDKWQAMVKQLDRQTIGNQWMNMKGTINEWFKAMDVKWIFPIIKSSKMTCVMTQKYWPIQCWKSTNNIINQYLTTDMLLFWVTRQVQERSQNQLMSISFSDTSMATLSWLLYIITTRHDNGFQLENRSITHPGLHVYISSTYLVVSIAFFVCVTSNLGVTEQWALE